MSDDFDLEQARVLSPRRKSSQASDLDTLVSEQLDHFNIDPETPQGRALAGIAADIYRTQSGLTRLWSATVECIGDLDRSDRIAFFNAKRFLCFQLAKVLDTLQNPLRRSYQSLVTQKSTRIAKGPYPVFDNVTAIFSATPVITRTATYLYACTEWIDDAFQGRELLHEIYSRLMNPTSVSLANHIVDLEAGELAGEYFAWNFNSGMAAIDGILSHLLGHQDIVIASRNVYGGTHQLLVDWFGKKSNLDVKIEFFDGYSSAEFAAFLADVRQRHTEALGKGRRIYTFLESPCNPHGYVLDVPGISRLSHEQGIEVICDCTVGTPFLTGLLKRESPAERPDFIVHSYTKDILGSGTTTAGVVIGRNERMFIPKGQSVTAVGPDGGSTEYRWDETLFWNVFYIKGAFLDADKAFEVLNGMRTMELRMIRKCISTIVLAKVLNAHPMITVCCNALEDNENYALGREHLYLGLPAPLFTFNMDSICGDSLSPGTFKQFFDSLEPVFGLQVSLGQMNTVVLCPAFTSHSELSDEALKDAGISRTTVRVAVGDEDPRVLLAHFIKASGATLDREVSGFSGQFPEPGEIDRIYREVYMEVHRSHIENLPGMSCDLD